MKKLLLFNKKYRHLTLPLAFTLYIIITLVLFNVLYSPNIKHRITRASDTPSSTFVITRGEAFAQTFANDESLEHHTFIAIKRSAEMYWLDADTLEPVWTATPATARTLTARDDTLSLPSNTLQLFTRLNRYNKVSVGEDFTINDYTVSGHLKPFDSPALSISSLTISPSFYPDDTTVDADTLYIFNEGTLTNPALGDIRVQYKALEANSTVTLLGYQSEPNSLTDLEGNYLYYSEDLTKDALQAGVGALAPIGLAWLSMTLQLLLSFVISIMLFNPLLKKEPFKKTLIIAAVSALAILLLSQLILTMTQSLFHTQLVAIIALVSITTLITAIQYEPQKKRK